MYPCLRKHFFWKIFEFQSGGGKETVRSEKSENFAGDKGEGTLGVIRKKVNYTLPRVVP